MTMLIVEISPEVYATLSSQAKVRGKTITEYSCDLLETAVRRTAEHSPSIHAAADTIKDTDVVYAIAHSTTTETLTTSPHKTAREILEDAGMVRPLGDELASLIGDDIPSLDEVINALSAAGSPSLTEILDEQRGSKTWRISS